MYDHIESVGAVRVLRIVVIYTPPALMMIRSSSRTSDFFAAIESSIVSFSVWSFTVSSSNRCILFRCFACNCSHNIATSSSISSMEMRSFDVTSDASDLLRFDMVSSCCYPYLITFSMSGFASFEFKACQVQTKTFFNY